MNQRLLTFLESIKNQGGISKAANSLFISQSYVSRTIKQAEDDYGIELLNRAKKPVELTLAGHCLLYYLRAEEQLHRTFNDEIRNLKQASQHSITLGITPPLANQWFKLILPTFYQRFPDYHTKIIEVSTSVAETLLSNRELDFFIGKTIHKPHVTSLPLESVALSLVIPKTSKIYEPDKLWRPLTPEIINQLDHELFIKSTGEYRFQDMVDHYFSERGKSINNRIEAPDLRVALSLALDGLGGLITFTNMIKPLEPSTPSINAFKIPISELSIDYSVSYIKNTVLSEPLDFLVSQATQLFSTFIKRPL